MLDNEDIGGLFMSPIQMWKLISLTIALWAIGCGCVSANEIHYRNGVACYKKHYPIVGTNRYEIKYEPIKVVPPVPYVAPKVDIIEYAPPTPYPTEKQLLNYDDDAYEKELIRIIARAQKDQSRRADIDALRKLGLRLDSGYDYYPADKYAHARSVYDRIIRPNEVDYNISVKDSLSYIGSKDPTDVITDQFGRNVQKLGDLFGDISYDQAAAVRDLIKSRAVNTEVIARALENKSKGEADALKIRALGDVVKREERNREVNISGSFLDVITQALGGTSQSVGTNSNSSELQNVINSKCGKCHNSDESTYDTARLDLKDFTNLNNSDLNSVMKQVRGGKMPPDSEEPLTEDEERILIDHYVNSKIKEN